MHELFLQKGRLPYENTIINFRLLDFLFTPPENKSKMQLKLKEVESEGFFLRQIMAVEGGRERESEREREREEQEKF